MLQNKKAKKIVSKITSESNQLKVKHYDLLENDYLPEKDSQSEDMRVDLTSMLEKNSRIW